MKKLAWCLRTKNGIELVEPNPNLATAYLLKAESSLETARLAKSKDWKISAAYYAMYFSLYSILMKIGIKCEIHTCTITFANELLQEYFSKEQFELLDEAFDARQDAQYYVDRQIDDRVYAELMAKTPHFISHCRDIVLRMTEEAIRDVREKLRKHAKKSPQR
ncbi:HEPN domain-containing protein [Candidatus Woesearchaeota archaeon]|nr:HEPN domain-containing protein [Candidatus Woesearchaeota archaeon]